MATYFKSSSFYLFISIVVFLAMACNNKTNEKTTEKKDTATDTTASTLQNPQPKAKLAGVEFTAFYTEAAEFISKVPDQKRIFFGLAYVQGVPALSGWGTNNGTFTDPPDITLKKAAATEVMLDDPIYDGNVKLEKKDVDTIKARLTRSGVAYVVFYPKPSSDYPGHVQYDIGYTNNNPGITKNLLFIEKLGSTTVANPSPPKQL